MTGKQRAYLRSMCNTLPAIILVGKEGVTDSLTHSVEEALLARVKEYADRFDAAMDDDLNTADALGAIFEIVKDANVSLNQQSGKAAVDGVLKTLLELTGVLGLLMKAAEEGLPPEIQQMADERAQARKEKNWKRSDELRDALAAAGYIVKDTPQGQNITKA